jgi:hypothetical protein
LAGSENFLKEKLFALTNQIQETSFSISTEIAESSYLKQIKSIAFCRLRLLLRSSLPVKFY